MHKLHKVICKISNPTKKEKEKKREKKRGLYLLQVPIWRISDSGS